MIDTHRYESVAIGYSDGTYDFIEGSGTLISPNVVLTSHHAIQNIEEYLLKMAEKDNSVKPFDAMNLKVYFCYEYTDPDHFPPGVTHPALGNYFITPVLGIKNRGNDCEDFALLVLTQPINVNYIAPGHSGFIATVSGRPVQKDEDIIVFQHPRVTDAERMQYPHMVTRVSGGPVNYPVCVTPGNPCQACACAQYTSREGSSGGGVYDKDMILIGVVKGTSLSRSQFVKMSDIVPKSRYLMAHVTPGPGNVPISEKADLSSDIP